MTGKRISGEKLAPARRVAIKGRQAMNLTIKFGQISVENQPPVYLRTLRNQRTYGCLKLDNDLRMFKYIYPWYRRGEDEIVLVWWR